ncbi:MAG: GNAT family N-acetyltransferase [Rhodobacteraceae bacterium]|nr:GNAT family N-acetyltransferase [Paracoccaceae bacterium]
MQVVDATWPAAQQIPCGPFMLRDGQGGGKRASSASLESTRFTDTDIIAAATAMHDLSQPALFMIRDGEEHLDQALDTLGYRSFDFVTLFASPVKTLTALDKKDLFALAAPEPIAAMAEIWAEAGIGPARQNVMRRTDDPKSCFLGRLNDTPAGAAFVGIFSKIAMVHALEIAEPHRRQGLGLLMMAGMASWAETQNADTFSLVVLSDNSAACGLYRHLGMTEVGHYHYRIKENP